MIDNFRDAVIESMRNYYDGIEPDKLKAASPGRSKYTKDYFDKYEKEEFEDSEVTESYED